MRTLLFIVPGALLVLLFSCNSADKGQLEARKIEKFNSQWQFHPGEVSEGETPTLNDSGWEVLDLPHDWSIDEPYHIDNPGGPGTKFMIGGIGWYRKTFLVPDHWKGKRVEITFDGVYRNSTVWINGNRLGTRPNGYISFKYDLTPWLEVGKENVLAVRVDNADQPNSRWYSGSGIYRNVWLTITDKTFIDPWQFFVTTPEVCDTAATVRVVSAVRNEYEGKRELTITTSLFDAAGTKVTQATSQLIVETNATGEFVQSLTVENPQLWSVENPYLYTVVQSVRENGKVIDDLVVPLGVRYFQFDRDKGFFLNGQSMKINGVCLHHDLGSLGAAINLRAMERQLQILKEMGCNGIRTSHNPPAPELLQLCDRMGFIVMDETFDMWKRSKTKFDYALDWDQWNEQDLRDHIVRDRNHPSVFIWSIGNEILEQWHPEGLEMTSRLASIVRALDNTRPITTGNNHPYPDNTLIKSGALDLIGYNYKHTDFEKFKETHAEGAFIATETVSGLATRGSYDMPSDSIRRWPYRWDQLFTDGNPDNSCSAYDNCSAPWGSTHEETWKVVKKHDYLSGMYIWTGFDYLGEPTPYVWPSRSSYFGIVDLAGFPKDVYYMYQSEWTDKTVLHLFPHWSWEEGQVVDVWAYYNQADEVELFLNGRSLGIPKKSGDDLHVQWRVPFEAGTLKAVSRKDGQEVMVREISTAGEPSQMRVTADRTTLSAGGEDLSFIAIDILDKAGNLVPHASNRVSIQIEGDVYIAGVDNGSQTSHDPFKADWVKAFNGKCLVIVRSGKQAGKAQVRLSSVGMEDQLVDIEVAK